VRSPLLRGEGGGGTSGALEGACSGNHPAFRGREKNLCLSEQGGKHRDAVSEKNEVVEEVGELEQFATAHRRNRPKKGGGVVKTRGERPAERIQRDNFYAMGVIVRFASKIRFRVRGGGDLHRARNRKGSVRKIGELREDRLKNLAVSRVGFVWS